MTCAVKQLGTCRPLGGLKKVKALLIHLNLHTDGLPTCHPKPLNTLLKSHVMRFFFMLFSSSAKTEFCVYQVSIVMVTNLLRRPRAAAAHKASNPLFYLSC